MDEAINKVISTNSGVDIGVAYTDLASNTSRHYGISEPFIAASTTKLLTAAYFLDQVQQGKFKLDSLIGGKTASTQLQQMIQESDNAAWELFDSKIGTTNLQNYASQVGLKNYNAVRNLATPDDIALLLQKLYHKQLLNAENTQLLMGYMQKANEAEYIPAAVPAPLKVYHKAGLLDDRVHDSAIIDNGKSPYVLVVFTHGHDTYNSKQRIKILQDITKATLP